MSAHAVGCIELPTYRQCKCSRSWLAARAEGRHIPSEGPSAASAWGECGAYRDPGHDGS